MTQPPLLLRGRLNRLTLTLGGIAVLMGIGCGYGVLGLGYVDETLVGGAIGGLLIGPLVIFDALDGRKRVVRLDGDGLALDGDRLAWADLQSVREQTIHRGIGTWFGRITLRRLRRLEIHAAGRTAPLAIGDEWLAPEDYAAVRRALEARVTIAAERVQEGE